ncbi:PREDICTED: thioredoxin-like protein CXXS1 isoform X2 [Populus euphratica]|uniref:Thioredoxin-like protein CXXS1 isoform X2 n=1 Tax=Populus euphratica TaxID=75702 RepID=A0AAJ6SVV5_POPEU|nr:PREDICTED: thioredoxin-like protein CXXS1 isoform X2 [Populus euphratica]
MESEATNKSRVVMVESEESWDFYISQATTQTRPIAVHFTSSWCMPSVAMNPVFEDLASAHPDILFLTVDVDAVKIFVSAIFTKIRLQIFGDLIPSHKAGNEHRVVSSGNFILIVIDMKDHH